MVVDPAVTVYAWAELWSPTVATFTLATRTCPVIPLVDGKVELLQRDCPETSLARSERAIVALGASLMDSA
jgi:hypothetical protein